MKTVGVFLALVAVCWATEVTDEEKELVQLLTKFLHERTSPPGPGAPNGKPGGPGAPDSGPGAPEGPDGPARPPGGLGFDKNLDGSNEAVLRELSKLFNEKTSPPGPVDGKPPIGGPNCRPGVGRPGGTVGRPGGGPEGPARSRGYDDLDDVDKALMRIVSKFLNLKTSQPFLVGPPEGPDCPVGPPDGPVGPPEKPGGPVGPPETPGGPVGPPETPGGPVGPPETPGGPVGPPETPGGPVGPPDCPDGTVANGPSGPADVPGGPDPPGGPDGPPEPPGGPDGPPKPPGGPGSPTGPIAPPGPVLIKKLQKLLEMLNEK